MSVLGESVLDILYQNYVNGNDAASEKINADFELLEEELGRIPPVTAEKLLERICRLCQKHEQQAFRVGVRTGVRLNMELNEK